VGSAEKGLCVGYALTNRILNDLVAAARPRWIEVVGDFNVRGGIKTEVRATSGKRPEI
jgi:7-cyano-7-deazaguanine reductase